MRKKRKPLEERKPEDYREAAANALGFLLAWLSAERFRYRNGDRAMRFPFTECAGWISFGG